MDWAGEFGFEPSMFVLLFIRSPKSQLFDLSD